VNKLLLRLVHPIYLEIIRYLFTIFTVPAGFFSLTFLVIWLVILQDQVLDGTLKPVFEVLGIFKVFIPEGSYSYNQTDLVKFIGIGNTAIYLAKVILGRFIRTKKTIDIVTRIKLSIAAIFVLFLLTLSAFFVSGQLSGGVAAVMGFFAILWIISMVLAVVMSEVESRVLNQLWYKYL
jgi:hypothetical protein